MKSRTMLVILLALVALAVLPAVVSGVLFLLYKLTLAVSLLVLSVAVFKIAR